MPAPLDTATEAPKRPESVRCVVGETTYLPEENVFSEIKKEKKVTSQLGTDCEGAARTAGSLQHHRTTGSMGIDTCRNPNSDCGLSR